MSDDAFAPPTSVPSHYLHGGLPTSIRAMAIIAIVLGGITSVTMGLGICMSAFVESLQDGMVSTQPSALRPQYRELLAVQNQLLPLGVFGNFTGVLVSGLMIWAGFMALSKRMLGLLSVASLSAVVWNVLFGMGMPLLTYAWTYPALEAYIRATADLGGPAGEAGAMGGMIGGLAGVVLGVVIYLGFSVFWIWGFQKIKAYQRELADGIAP